MPLRASNYRFAELKPVVLLGNLEYLKREWNSIKNFPKVYLMPVSCLVSKVKFGPFYSLVYIFTDLKCWAY